MFEGQFEALEKRRKEMKAAGEEGLSDIEKRHKANATLDGADQWTWHPVQFVRGAGPRPVVRPPRRSFPAP